MKSHFEHRAEMRQLAEQMNGTNDDAIIEQMNQLEREYKQARKLDLLNKVNAEQAKRREYAAQLWAAEEVTKDITTADGKLHKAKARKYPIFSAIPYLYVTSVKDGRIVDVSINGQRFSLYHVKHGGYNQPNEYTRPASFADFLKLNNTMPADLTIEQYEEMSAKLEEMNKKVAAAMDDYKREFEKMGGHSFNTWGILGQNAQHFYTYSPNE